MGADPERAKGRTRPFRSQTKIPPPVVSPREKAKAAGKECEIVVYPDTPHAFNADYRPSYRKEAAEDGWKRMLVWFKKNGVA